MSSKVSRNDITGDAIQTRAASEQYKDNLEKIDFSIKLDVDASSPPPYKLTQRSKDYSK